VCTLYTSTVVGHPTLDLHVGRALGQDGRSAAYGAGAATKPVPCGTCGTFIDPRSATFSLDGNLACQPFASRGQIDAAKVRGSEGLSFNRTWVRVAVIAGLVLLRLILRFGSHH